MSNTKIKVLIIISLIALAFILTPYLFLNEKKVHLSIDDVSASLKRISTSQDSSRSLWNDTFFSFLLDVHSKTGAKFSLYFFEEDLIWNIDKFLSAHRFELAKNNDWLRFALHAKKF